MNYSEYITASLAKGTLGSSISVGIFALIGVYALIGIYFGFTRGFSKSVIRFFTVLLSAFGALFGVMAICNIIINLTNASGVQTVDQVVESYFPGVLDSAPVAIRSLLSQMNSETATIFVMMIVCILIAPILFIALFYLLKTLTFPLYKLLAGLIGAIDYGKGIASMIFGALVGLVQGVVIAGILLTPISGLCGVIEDARKPLIKNEGEPNQNIVQAYDQILDDIIDNPVFDTINDFGGKAAYDSMVNVTIRGTKVNMSEEIKGLSKIFADALPLLHTGFDWKDPSESEKAAVVKVVEELGDNTLIASLTSDIMRGIAICVDNGSITIPLEGTNKELIEDVIRVFHTSTKDNIDEDLDMIVDIYLIMCDHRLLVAFNEGQNDELRDILTEKNAKGDTIIDEILDRLNESERGKPIVHSFTKLSLSLMQREGDTDSAELYENVKDDLHTVLSHNKSDFDSDEEYREAVKSDLDQALAENNLVVSNDVKENMIDYIEKNFSDTSEITDDDINDAILSYYNSYASAKENREETPE